MQSFLNTQKMETFNRHIKQLLMRHECVIVPGLGGFITYRHGAYVRNGFVYPPAKGIRFNNLLNYNDGMLCEMYMNDGMLSYADALKAIDEAVVCVHNTLREKGFCQLGAVGTLRLHGDDTISLSCENVSFLPGNYGLTPVALNRLEARESDVQAAKTIVLQVSSSVQRVLRYAAAVIVVSVIAMLVPQNTANDTHYAAFSFDSLRHTAVLQNTVRRMDMPAADTCQTEAMRPDIQEALVEKEAETERNVVAKATNKEEHKYHLIVASLKSQQQAEQYIAEQTQYTANTLTIIQEGNKFRISAMGFAKYADAIEYADSIRNTTGGKHAWIMCSKR